MQDYLEFPINIKELGEINSDNIRHLIGKCKFEDQKTSLDFLRNLYRSDRVQFHNMIDELSLRGFKFYTEKPNNILPNYTPTVTSYIVARSNKDRFKDLDYNRLGLSGFLTRFNVNSDLFFHKIPIKGFKLLNASMDVKDIEDVFRKSGFEISGGQTSGEEPQVENKKVDAEIYENSFLAKLEQFFLQVPIEEVFKGSEFSLFLQFCKIKDIQKLTDLTSSLIAEFGKSNGVNNAEFQPMIEKFKSLILTEKTELYETYASPLLWGKAIITREVGLLIVSEVFIGNKFNRFLDFCEKYSILKIGDIQQSHIQIFMNSPGIGLKKFIEVIDILQDVLKSHASKEIVEQGLLTSQLSIKNVFQENKFNTFRNFCFKKGIEFINDISLEHLKEYGKLTGVGIGRLNIVKDKLKELNCKLNSESNSPDDYSFAIPMKINELFVATKFVLFREFCNEKMIVSIDQINDQLLEEFSRFRGVGKTKLNDIHELLVDFKVNSQINSQFLEFEKSEIFELVKEFKVTTLLNTFQINNYTQSSLILEEISHMKLERIKEHFDPEHIISLQRKIIRAKKINTQLLELPTVLKENQYMALYYRYGENLTLEETGKHFGVTRERVRQIAKKALTVVKSYLGRNYFFAVISLLSSSKSLITSAELQGIIGSENKYLIGILKEDVKGFTYFEKLDAFFFTSDKKVNFKVLDDFISDLPNYFNLHEYQEQLEDILESFGVEEPSVSILQTLLQQYGFNKYGNHYSRRKLTLVDILTILFRQYIHEPLRLDEDGYQVLRNLAKKHLNYEIDSSLRAIDARLRDSDEIILVDSSTFQWFNNESFDQSFINKIDVYLKSRFAEIDVINIEEVYNYFLDDVKQFNILSKLHLYSLVRFYLDEEYKIGKGNTLNIFSNDSEKLNQEERLLRVVNSFGGECEKNQIKEALHWPSYRIDLTISTSKKLLTWGVNKVTTFERIGLTTKEEQNLIHLIKKCLFKDKFTTTGIIFREMKFDPTLAHIISKAGIDDIVKLSSIIKVLMPDLKGHSNFIYEEGCQFTNFEEVMANHFKGETTRKELQDFAIEYGYKEVMAAVFLRKLIDTRTFIEVDVDILYPTSQLKIPDSVEIELVKFVEESLKGKGFISISNLKGYKRRLPNIGFRWNPYLIKSLLVVNGYRQIMKIISNYKYDKIIVVKNESKIQTFEELVHFELMNEYTGNMHERFVYDFLEGKGILREQDSPYSKVLPHELRNAELISVDNLGIVKIK